MLILADEKTESDVSSLLLSLSRGTFLIEMTLDPQGSRNCGSDGDAAHTAGIRPLTLLLELSK